MRDALPIIYRLVESNLGAVGIDFESIDTSRLGQNFSIAAPHIAWLFKAIEHLADSRVYSCRVRFVPLNRARASTDPSRESVVPLNPHGHTNYKAFAYEFSQALISLATSFKEITSDPTRRLELASMWIAAAALTAHLQLLQEESCEVLVDQPIGGGSLAFDAVLHPVLADFPAEVIQALPLYARAERAAANRCINEIRLALFTLGGEGTRARNKKEGRVVDLLAHLASRKSKSNSDPRWPRKFEQQAVLLLVEHQICDTQNAMKLLREIGISDSFSLRVDDTEISPRLPSKNAKDQAAHRGRGIYFQYWAEACAAEGLLNPALLKATIKSKKLVANLLATICNPALGRLLEVGVVRPADTSASGQEQDDLPRATHDKL
jgi:hypothetical protein